MTVAELVGLALQALGTLVTGWALKDEYGNRRPAVRPPARPPVRNPWEGKWAARVQRVPSHERERWHRTVADSTRNPFGGGRMVQRAGPDPEVVRMAEYIRDVFAEARDGLRDDWDRQDRAEKDLHASTVALFDSLQSTHEATRRRVRVEMVGLAIVMLGTILSSF